jgi:putative ABC transport system substrate-binding protein
MSAVVFWPHRGPHLSRITTLMIALAWPFVMLAPVSAQPHNTPRIVWVSVFPLSQVRAYTEAFRQGLQLEGLVEAKDVELVLLSAEGSPAQLQSIVDQALALRPAVVVAQGAAVFGFKDVRTVPVVFGFSGDPVAAGFTTSIARPSSNLTGVSFMAAELNAKRLDLLKVAAPGVAKVVLMGDPIHPGVDLEVAVSKAAASTLGMDLRWLPTRNVTDVREALAAFETEKPDDLVVLPDAVMIEGRREIADFALRHRIPAVSGWAMFAQSDGLFTYGPKLSESFKRLAHYTARILKGSTPADLPIERSTHLEFIVNAKTASRIGLSLPQQILGFADEIID